MDDDTLRQAAIQAEHESGRRDEDRGRSQGTHRSRLAWMSAGTLGGLAMMPLPGPGLPEVAIGLAILACDVAWADRLLTRGKLLGSQAPLALGL